MSNNVSGMLSVVLVVVIALYFYLSGGGKEITAEDFGENWPFTVDSGSVECRNGNALVFVANGKTYGLNGFGDVIPGVSDLRSIWRDDPKNPGTGLKVNIGPVQKVAETLC